MAKVVDRDGVGRLLIADGEAYLIHCAVRNDDQSSPAEKFLAALELNSLPDDPDQSYGPDEQPSVYAALMHRIKFFADHAVPPIGGAVNYLSDGIWEFKRRNKRVTFYDTKGKGEWTRKARRDRAHADTDDEYWEIPNFDEFIRLGHSFLKSTEQTPQQDLEDADEVRREDLKND